MNEERVAVAGGGAAGFFAAITCKEASPATDVLLFERGPHFLSKVRISGGGRCNVTHACFSPAEFAGHYPRGGRELLGPFSRFQARDTVKWFESRGVSLRAESDGRMFPVSDSSDDVVRCLQDAAARARVRLESACGIERARRIAEGRFELHLSGGRTLECTKVLIATGGCRTAAGGRIPLELGHTIESPVPSFFSFHIEKPWVRALAGVSVQCAEVSVPGTGHRAGGALIFTHAGMSGPAILALSAWGARDLHDRNYRFPLRVAWLPGVRSEAVKAELDSVRRRHPARLLIGTPIASIPGRLWENLAALAGIAADTRWSGVSRASARRLASILESTELQVSGKSLNKDEFVTCGGVRLSEVDFRTMESRLHRGMYFAGEVLDIDGLTGGFNLQAAWTTGWIAGNALAASRT